MQVVQALDEKALATVFEIRKIVFVEEQKVSAAEEFDEYDIICQHILLYHEGHAIATGRLRIFDNIAKLERICVLAEFRKSGAGKLIIEALEKMAKELGITQAKLNAQTQARGFYEKAGYVKASEEFLEAGIKHLCMVKRL